MQQLITNKRFCIRENNFQFYNASTTISTRLARKHVMKFGSLWEHQSDCHFDYAVSDWFKIIFYYSIKYKSDVQYTLTLNHNAVREKIHHYAVIKHTGLIFEHI